MSGPYKSNPFCCVNCGAMPTEKHAWGCPNTPKLEIALIEQRIKEKEVRDYTTEEHF